ncbi:HAMP domain-containing sensor histidine kinase [Prolixibacteraceae bacterium Z1-6]|uniref:histidine kinase n=1 Tax=Draconibacterium aestuarii TaxID=2998507 RepID=A0A9X3FBN9_9BACT|nr:HAMP domain-containing sensor histidine kinase [Prolixibacteraceae bacterium Z1-6]
MKGKALKYIILLATVSIAGIFLIQFSFIKSSYNISDKQFKESASVALKEVAWQILVATGSTENFDSITPVEIISNSNYLVNVGTAFDKDLLKSNLIRELKKHEIYYDFEFAIFDPSEQQMDERTLVSSNSDEKPSSYDFPVNEKYSNYFAVHFPDRSSYFNSRLSIWYFLTGLLVLVVFFFGYTLSVIIRQRQLSEIQKNFVNNLTHELKTPISAIALSANVINNKTILENPKRLFEYTRIIQEQNTRLARNVENVLNLASIERNRIKLNLEELDAQQFLLKSIEIFKHSTSGQKANISTKLSETKAILLADKFHFSNLLSNILENAVKYCEQTPEIIVSFEQRKNHFELCFADNGIGIPREYRKKIFKKFYRIPTGNVHDVKGFGLGLDYVHKIVKAHKWKIKVEENPKGGSIFTLIIPN